MVLVDYIVIFFTCGNTVVESGVRHNNPLTHKNKNIK